MIEFKEIPNMKYLSMFRIGFINALQYRAAAFGSFISRFVWGFMEILAFAAVYSIGNNSFEMELQQTVSYIWMRQALLIMFSVVYGDGDIYSSIENGSIAYELVRPMGLYSRWFCKSSSNRLAATVVHCLPVVIAACILPLPYRLIIPTDITQIILFLFSTIIGFCVVVSFAMLMYISLFYIISQRGIKIIVTAISTFLSGGIIPLPFFPKSILNTVQLLPFAAMQNIPLQIFTGNIYGMAAVYGIIFQILWLTILICIGQITMRKALRKVIVQGG